MINLPGDIDSLTAVSSPPPTTPFLQACPVNILVLYTEDALAENPDIGDQIKLGILNTNDILKNSDISRSILFFDKVITLMVPNSEFEESGDIEIDKEYVHSNQYIKSLRNQYESDIVIILTSDVYSGLDGAVSAFGLDDGSAIDEAYALVEANRISIPYYAFSHEIFHLYGARHEQKYDDPEETNCPASGDDEGNIFAHGYLIKKHNSQKKRNTLMAVCLQDIFSSDDIKKIKYLSNPNVKYKKWKTGIDETNYNAKQVRNMACVVANYRYSFRPFAYVVGPNYVCSTDEYIILTAIVGGLQGNYDYFWRYSTDGLHWSDYIESYNNIFTLSNTFPAGTNIFIELFTGTSPENMMKAFWSTVVQDGHSICFRSNSPNKFDSTTNENTFFSVFPNPASGNITVENQALDSSCAEIELITLSGEKIDQVTSCSKFTILFTGDLPDGLYILKCSDEIGWNEYHKLIIHNSN